VWRDFYDEPVFDIKLKLWRIWLIRWRKLIARSGYSYLCREVSAQEVKCFIAKQGYICVDVDSGLTPARASTPEATRCLAHNGGLGGFQTANTASKLAVRHRHPFFSQKGCEHLPRRPVGEGVQRGCSRAGKTPRTWAHPIERCTKNRDWKKLKVEEESSRLVFLSIVCG